MCVHVCMCDICMCVFVYISSFMCRRALPAVELLPRAQDRPLPECLRGAGAAGAPRAAVRGGGGANVNCHHVIMTITMAIRLQYYRLHYHHYYTMLRHAPYHAPHTIHSTLRYALIVHYALCKCTIAP